MGQYLYTLIAAAVFVAVITALSPGGEATKTGRFVAFVGALVIGLCMLGPLPGLLETKQSDIFVKEPSFDEENDDCIAEYYANSAGMALESIFGTDSDEIKARVSLTNEGRAEKIELILKEPQGYSLEEAGELLSQILETTVLVREE